MSTEQLVEVNKVVLRAEAKISEITGKTCSLFMNLEADLSVVALREIIEKELNVTYTQIVSRNRNRQILTARYIYIWFLRNHYKKTLATIAAELGRDHTSVIHALAAMRRWLDVKDYIVTIPFNYITNILKQHEAKAN